MDDKLAKARETINETDREMAALFERRMRAVRDVAEYKKEHGLPIFDEAREKEVLARNLSLVDDEVLKPYYGDFLQHTMDVSKNYQRDISESEI